MSHEIDRRTLLRGATAALLASGCDQLDVEVEPLPGGFATADGIVPITPNAGFYVFQYGATPVFDPSSWVCSVRIDGEEVAQLTPAVLESLEPIEIEHTLQCIGGNPRNTLISNAVWGGLPFIDVLARLGVELPADLDEVVFRGADAYHTAVPVSDHDEERLWLVWEMNGEPLPFEHGAPCRFLCQGRYGTKNVKWPVSVDFARGAHVGYWEGLNWSPDATYQPNVFVFAPREGSSHRGEVVAFGTAHAGQDPVTGVDVSFDGGGTWSPAEITYSPGANRWTLWRAGYDGPPGSVALHTRVHTASGASSVGPEGTDFRFGYDGGMAVVFSVNA